MSPSPYDALETNSEHSSGKEDLRFYSSTQPKEMVGGPPSCTTSTMASTTDPSTTYEASSLLRNAELSASQTTVAPIESLASRRLRLLPKSQQIMAMLQKTDQKRSQQIMATFQKTDQKRQLTNANAETAPIKSAPQDLTSEVSSLISHSSYSISLDDGDVLLPPPRTAPYKLATDLELNDDDAENVHRGETVSIVTSIRGDESISKPKAQQPKVEDKKPNNPRTKLDVLRHRRQQNKRHRQHERPNNNDSMSKISALTFDCNMSFMPMRRKPVAVEVQNSSVLTTNSSYLQRLNHHHQNISTTTNHHPSINAKKTERLESIQDRIMTLQTENHHMRAMNKQLTQYFKHTQDPTTVKLNEMCDRMKKVELENLDLRAQNLDLEAQVKKQVQQLIDKDALYRKHQQQNSLVIPSPQENRHLTNGATLMTQWKEIEVQRNAYMTTRKRLEDKRKQCRDILGKVSPVPSGALLGKHSLDGGSGNDEGNASAIVDDDEEESFLSSSMSLSDYENNKDADRTTGDRVKEAHAMVVAQKLSQAEQEIALLTTKVETLQTLNSNLLSKFQEQDDDFCSVTKMETSSLKQREEISTLKGQLKQKSNACMSMEHQLGVARTEIMDLRDMHDFEVQQMNNKFDNMKAEAERMVDWLKNQLTIYQRKLGVQVDRGVEGQGIDGVDCLNITDYKYDNYESNIIASDSNDGKTPEKMSTMAENQNIMAEFYRAQQYLQDAHNQAADIDTGVVSTTGMEGLSKKEQEDLVKEIAEERIRWQATTSPPVTPKEGTYKIPLVVDVNQ